VWGVVSYVLRVPYFEKVISLCHWMLRLAGPYPVWTWQWRELTLLQFCSPVLDSYTDWATWPDRPRPTTLLPPRSNGKPEAATAVYKLLMMGKRMPETYWAVFERRAINLRDWCICLVDLFECMMMHGLTNPKFRGSTFNVHIVWF